ncbi:hypothetical protein BGW38_000802 [Lunasporangiospora selenospora]|uniref:Branched-chain-amino-acid transaminase n=1 Tax=Lunasporangiospora selenospora TaxID=979761 RepID=A0A9P6KEK5_9FUNG|nr:hypothetical protein BGW38_000802 [Lunasporangiospora selenospora]
MTCELPPTPTTAIDWDNLGFKWVDTNGYVKHVFSEGRWDEGEFVRSSHLNIHICAPALNYGQECFEGIKAFRCKDGQVRIFRPDINAKRMMYSADISSMTPVPEDIFVRACERAVANNLEFVPPYGSGGALYLRPLLLGTGPEIGLYPAPEFTFIVMVIPVGNFYKSGVKPVDCLVVETFDRAAPLGTGAAKLGGNYAPVLKHSSAAKEKGYAITLHLDSKTHTNVDEFSTSNFVALTYPSPEHGNQPIFCAPDSPSILNSVTKQSLVQLAKSFGWTVDSAVIPFTDITNNRFEEIAACGTAAVITPVKTIERDGTKTDIGTPATTGEIGAGFQRLFTAMRGIQNGDIADSYGWMQPAEGIRPRKEP